MRISEIKNLTDNAKARNILTYLWDMEPFHVVMVRYKKQDDGIDSLYKALMDTFYQVLKSESFPANEKSKIKEDIRRLSLELYGDRDYWIKGSQWEQLEEEKKIRREERAKAIQVRREQYEKFADLRKRLDIKPISKHYDVFYLIARDEELSNALVERKEEIKSRAQLYECCASILKKRIKAEELKQTDYLILCRLSALAFGDRYYWAFLEGVDRNKIDERLWPNEQ